LIELLKQNSNYHLKNIDKNDSHFYPEVTTIADIRDKKTEDFVARTRYCGVARSRTSQRHISNLSMHKIEKMYLILYCLL
jgi:hypothetical protein